MREQVLKMLRDEEEVSGEKLSKRLGVSRAAVAKHIKALREAGYDILAAPHRGYRFISAPDILSAAEIGCFLQEPQAGWLIHYYGELNSTTTVLRSRAEEGAPHGTVIIADKQTDARGRLNRSWHSPPGCGLWMSYLLRPPFSPQLAQTITLTSACAVALALERLGFRCGIKWPNDILSLTGLKLCGIKSDICADMDSVQWLVTGIGLNISTPSFPPPLEQKATSLYLLSGQKLARAPIAAAVLDELYRLYQTLLYQGFKPIREIWLKYAVSLGKQVRISDVCEEYSAVALDLDENGYLLVERDGQIQIVTSGDIIL